MKRIVLDASALMTFFDGRPGAAKVEELITSAAEGKCKLLMSVVNWGEVYYSVWRAKGPGMARKIARHRAFAHRTGRRPLRTNQTRSRTPRRPQTPLRRLLRRRASHRSQSLPRHQRRRLRQTRTPPHPPLDPLISPSSSFRGNHSEFSVHAADQTKRPGGLLRGVDLL